jgi:ElaB/YqjD/DUF883 family membrane-anchored ribosome-binding protein
MITRERVGTEIGLMTGRIKQKFANSRDSLASAGTTVSETTRRAARKTDYYVHDNAWKMMGVVAGLAFIGGFLLSQVRDEKVVVGEGLAVDSDGNPVKVKKEKSHSLELLTAAAPLLVMAWKTFQSNRCARRAEM